MVDQNKYENVRLLDDAVSWWRPPASGPEVARKLNPQPVLSVLVKLFVIP